MYERIQKISKYLNKEQPNSSSHIKPELLKKFNIFKKWLIDNGAIFAKNIDFPYAYGPFNLIGCKSISDINENESILLIPKKLMIISKELHYLDEFVDSIEEELYEDDDLATLYLTLHLYLENKNKNSFFRPYLDLIFSNYNYLNDFTEENMQYFDDDEKIVESLKNTINDISLLYNTIINSNDEKFDEMTKEEFFFCYSQVVSRQFYIDEECSSLIPLADLLNHRNIDIHYEIYDSDNYIFKYSTKYSLEIDVYIDIRPTFIKEYPIIKNKINNLEVYNVNDYKKNKKIVKLEEKDYFSISTSKGEIIKKGNQVFNNYSDNGNKYLLKNYGFCLIDNEYESTPIIIYIETGTDIYLHKYLEIIFGKRYKIKSDSFKKFLKINISFNDICFYLIKYYRFNYYYRDLNDIKQYINYKFDINLEIKFISLALECLKDKIKIMNKKNNLNDDLTELENELYYKENKNAFKINAFIYRVTQKINIMNQIGLVECILNIMKKYKNNIISYSNLMDYENEFINLSQFDTDENSKIKIFNFIRKSKNIVG